MAEKVKTRKPLTSILHERDYATCYRTPMEHPVREHGTSVVVIFVPLLLLLFGRVPWDGGIRYESTGERLARLRQRSFFWEEDEYKKLLETADVNLRTEGKPLFVVAGIESKNLSVLRQMLTRNAELNSSDWGCTALLEAIAADNDSDDRLKREHKFTSLLLERGANPNILPSLDGRSKVGHDHPCFTKRQRSDDALDGGNKSILAILSDEHDWEMVGVLLDHGARPKNKEDALSIRRSLLEGSDPGSRPKEPLYGRLNALLHTDLMR